MEGIVRDLRYAMRTLARMRGATLAAILTLGIGIGAATTMTSVVHAAMLRPLPFPNADRLAVIFNAQVTPREGVSRLRWSWPRFVELRQSVTAFEPVASFTTPLVAVSGGQGEPEQMPAEIVSSGYFETLGVKPISGRTFRAEDDTAAAAATIAIISARLWQTRFAADPSLIGKAVLVNGVPLEIVGILPDGFAGLSGRAVLWIPPPMAARLTYADYLTTPQHFISVIARLKDGVSLERANAELETLAARLASPESPSPTGATWNVEAMALDDVRIDPQLRWAAVVLLGAATGVLLIACVNVASLLLARARTREREIALRLAIGAGRRRLLQQLLTESAVLAVAAGACGALLAAWGVAAFARLAPDAIPSGRNQYLAVAAFGQPELDSTVLWLALAIAIVTIFVFGLVPALAATRAGVATALKEGNPGSRRHGRTLSALVVTEVAIASLLLTGSALLIEHVMQLHSRRTGYVADNVLTFWVRPPASRYPIAEGAAILQPLLERIQGTPSVEMAALNRCTPFTGCSRTVASFPDRPADLANAPVVGRHYISPDYFRTLGIPIIAGRALTDADRAGTLPVAVVNETGARRFWPGESAVGRRVWFGSTTGPFDDPASAVTIVGIAGDVKYEGVDLPDAPMRADFYTSYHQFSYSDSMFMVKARAGSAGSLVADLRRAVSAVDPSLPIYDVMWLDDRVDAAVAQPRFNAALLTSFAGAAVLLAAIGVYGVLSYSVSSRLREIGVRLALGADGPRVIRSILAGGMRLALVGSAIGLAASLALARFVQSLVHDIPASDPLRLAAVVVLMTAVAALSAFIPARRASKVDPVIVLRNE